MIRMNASPKKLYLGIVFTNHLQTRKSDIEENPKAKQTLLKVEWKNTLFIEQER